jgi:hypothetical protein
VHCPVHWAWNPTALSIGGRQRLVDGPVVRWHARKGNRPIRSPATVGNRDSSGAPDCPVSSQTGKFFGFLMEKATSPLALEAIKRPLSAFTSHQTFLEHTTTPRLYDHAIWSVWEIWARFRATTLLFLFLSLSLTCVHVVAAIVLLRVYSTSSLTPFFINIICVRRERLQHMEIPHKRDWVIRKTYVTLKFDLWITWERLSVTLDQRMSP